MRVLCVSDKGSGGFVREGNIYNVYAILMGDDGLSILLSEDFDFPMNHPLESFKILSHSLPPNWFFRFINQKETETRKDLLKAIWGYKEIVYYRDHYYNLIDRESGARNIFRKRKEEIDEYEKLRSRKT